MHNTSPDLSHMGIVTEMDGEAQTVRCELCCEFAEMVRTLQSEVVSMRQRINGLEDQLVEFVRRSSPPGLVVNPPSPEGPMDMCEQVLHASESASQDLPPTSSSAGSLPSPDASVELCNQDFSADVTVAPTGWCSEGAFRPVLLTEIIDEQLATKNAAEKTLVDKKQIQKTRQEERIQSQLQLEANRQDQL